MKGSPEPKTKREANFPLGVVLCNDRVFMLYKNSSKGGKEEVFLMASKTGTRFVPPKTKKKVAIAYPDRTREDVSLCDSFRISKSNEGFFMTYRKNFSGKVHLMGALSEDLLSWKITGKISDISETGMLVPDYRHEGAETLYFGDMFLKAAFSKTLQTWHVSSEVLLSPRGNYFDFSPIKILGVGSNPRGILVLYDASNSKDQKERLSVGGALFSLSAPNKCVWRSEAPLFDQILVEKGENLHTIGAVFFDKKINIYWFSEKRGILTVSIPHPFPAEEEIPKSAARLNKFEKNPILSPHPGHDWASDSTFNPTAFYDGKKIHILYRAMGDKGISTFGYASSLDGFTINERDDKPAYIPREKFEGAFDPFPFDAKEEVDWGQFSASGGGWGGCEDPRLTKIGDTVYLVYVAFNGYPETNIAFSSIPYKDFLEHRWSKWTKPVLITSLDPDHKNPNTLKNFFQDKPWYKPQFGIGHKNPAILPEKINRKYVIFHRIWPNIVFDYVDELKFDGKTFLRGDHSIPVRPNMWDSHKISCGAAPMKTPLGWLLIYNAVGRKDMSRYKIGAMLLDLKNPEKVLHRSNSPILEPREHYENYGNKFGVVFAGGAVIKDGQLIVYYGGSDKVVCAATSPLDKFLDNLKKDKIKSPKLTRVA